MVVTDRFKKRLSGCYENKTDKNMFLTSQKQSGSAHFNRICVASLSVWHTISLRPREKEEWFQIMGRLKSQDLTSRNQICGYWHCENGQRGTRSQRRKSQDLTTWHQIAGVNIARLVLLFEYLIVVF